MSNIYNEVINNEQKVIPEKDEAETRLWCLWEITSWLLCLRSVIVGKEEQGIGNGDEDKLNPVGDSPFLVYWTVFIVL